MLTCFIFANHLDEDQCLCMRLAEDASVDAPLAMRPLHEVRLLQHHARTMVVIPTSHASLHEVAMGQLAARQMRAAIPYALEEQVAQPVESLHMAFDSRHVVNDHCLVVVMDKAVFSTYIERLERLQLAFDVLTLDWFALNEAEVCLTDQFLLVNDSIVKGALNKELASMYLNRSTLPGFKFKDSTLTISTRADFKSIDTSFAAWAASRLLHARVIHLCQGEFARKGTWRTSAYWYRVAGILGTVCLISWFVIQGLYWHGLTKRIAATDAKIAVIYHAFFPGSSRVFSPKFRIEQWLKNEGQVSSSLWDLLGQLALAIKADTRQMTIEQLRFQNNVLSVNLTTQDFATLDALQARLKRAGVQVGQAQAGSQDKHVQATLELRG